MLFAGFCVVIAASWLLPAPEQKVVFMDVGQGDSILLQDRTAQVLIDGGQGDAVLRRLAEEMPYLDRTIEIVILTHPQRDHLEGLLHVLERYNVQLVLMPEVEYDSQLYAEWLSMLDTYHVPIKFARDGQRLHVGEMEFNVLWPAENPAALAAILSDVNNASVSTRVDYGEMSFLLTGDAEKRVESMLVQRARAGILDVDLLKAGHHGSNTSTYEPLLKAASASAVVVSVGSGNTFGHPHPDVLARVGDLPIWRTDQSGSVRFVRQDGRWFVHEADKNVQ